MKTAGLLCLSLCSLPLLAQKRVDPGMTYQRVLAIVPVIGSGTWNDPKRPMFAPVPAAASASASESASAGAPASAANPADRTGIIAFQHQLSDDGNLALVEFVAVNRSAFAALLASTDPRVQVFEVGKQTQASVQAAFQQHKANFNFANFRPLPVQ